MAPPKRKSSQTVDYSQKPALSEVICPICMEILVEPVTMPCSHELCMPCFQENVQNGEANFVCPMCRLRISSWARKNAREHTLVNKERWAQIQRYFPEKCERRLRGEENDTLDDLSDEELPITNFPVVSEPGELRREYEEQMKKFEEQRKKEQEAALKASMEYIQRMQEEEEQQRREREEKLKKDEEVARQLMEMGSPAVQGKDKNDSDVVIVTPTNSRVSSKQTNGSGSIMSFLSPRSNNKREPEPEKYITPPPSCCRKGLHGNDICQPGSSKKSSPYQETDTNTKDRSSTSSLEIGEGSPNTSGHNSSHHSDKENRSEPSSRPGSFTVAPRVNRSSSGSLKELLPTLENVSRSASVESRDSITEELNHFKPIHSSPRTPPKKGADGRPLSPVIVRSTPRNLNSADFGKDTSYELEGSSKVLQRWLRVMEERNAAQEISTKSRATCTAGVESSPKRKTRNRSRNVKREPASALEESVADEKGETAARQYEVPDTLDSDSDSTDIERESPRKKVRVVEVNSSQGDRNVHSNVSVKEEGPLQPKNVPNKGKGKVKQKQSKPQRRPSGSKTIDSYFEASPPQSVPEGLLKTKVTNGNGPTELPTQDDSDKDSEVSSTRGTPRKRKASRRQRNTTRGASTTQQKTEEDSTDASAKPSGKRTCKTKHTEPDVATNTTDNTSNQNGENGHRLTPEEEDHLLALRLQKQFDLESRRQVEPNRKKGTIDEYMLRGSRKRTQSTAKV
ncbi:E3 ubiquitin-protein ligase RNF169-like isoform X2 [Branchiostoma floridae]|uniref:RING-type E3 ubiquitin transferase n=1 Tax=Branchiostoma floridae TaxID=7739 RepID=A0A9J7M397_BRAFL|nr:E3 ubiquitin-protein ligase RNF169-like isoform X2 [Branchiostoma floridae]